MNVSVKPSGNCTDKSSKSITISFCIHKPYNKIRLRSKVKVIAGKIKDEVMRGLMLWIVHIALPYTFLYIVSAL